MCSKAVRQASTLLPAATVPAITISNSIDQVLPATTQWLCSRNIGRSVNFRAGVMWRYQHTFRNAAASDGLKTFRPEAAAGGVWKRSEVARRRLMDCTCWQAQPVHRAQHCLLPSASSSAKSAGALLGVRLACTSASMCVSWTRHAAQLAAVAELPALHLPSSPSSRP